MTTTPTDPESRPDDQPDIRPSSDPQPQIEPTEPGIGPPVPAGAEE